mgnify:CR=1 FL=1
MNRFEGDGRIKIYPDPQYVRVGTHPISVTRATARNLSRQFDYHGRSNHSGLGSVLWVIIEHCKTNGIKHVLRGKKGFGYEVVRK